MPGASRHDPAIALAATGTVAGVPLNRAGITATTNGFYDPDMLRNGAPVQDEIPDRRIGGVPLPAVAAGLGFRLDTRAEPEPHLIREPGGD
jgi:hypothetical protein